MQQSKGFSGAENVTTARSLGQTGFKCNWSRVFAPKQKAKEGKAYRCRAEAAAAPPAKKKAKDFQYAFSLNQGVR